jgi:hypothetical protein
MYLYFISKIIRIEDFNIIYTVNYFTKSFLKHGGGKVRKPQLRELQLSIFKAIAKNIVLQIALTAY